MTSHQQNANLVFWIILIVLVVYYALIPEAPDTLGIRGY